MYDCVEGLCCENESVHIVDAKSRDELLSKVTRHKGGYMLSFRYYEQQTQTVLVIFFKCNVWHIRLE